MRESNFQRPNSGLKPREVHPELDVAQKELDQIISDLISFSELINRGGWRIEGRGNLSRQLSLPKGLLLEVKPSDPKQELSLQLSSLPGSEKIAVTVDRPLFVAMLDFSIDPDMNASGFGPYIEYEHKTTAGTTTLLAELDSVKLTIIRHVQA